jgi:hypothetical protein
VVMVFSAKTPRNIFKAGIVFDEAVENR